MNHKERVLIVEDDRVLLRVLKDNFEYSGYVVHTAADGEEGLRLARELGPDLVVLDVMLPRLGGFEICRQLRQEQHSMPILMLTARDGESDVVHGLNNGADDYLTKPFRVAELLARANALLRRLRHDAPPTARFGPFQLDREARQLLRDGATVPLPPKEFALLDLLTSSPGRAFSRREILDTVWGRSVIVTPRSVDRCVTGLRHKIEDDLHHPRWIQTVRDFGYRFEPAPGPTS